MFVLLDQTQEMRSYEAVFGDLEGRRLVCIKRHLMQAFWKDGYYLCTYKPNYRGQQPLKERDVDNKKVYPFSYLQVNPMKGRFFYRYFDNHEGLGAPRMRADNPWLGFMVVCCTPMVRCGKWTASFKRRGLHTAPTIHVDQWRNCVDVGPGNDMLAALCMAYVFDRYQCQPLVTVFGMDPMEDGADDRSINTHEQNEKFQDPLAGIGDYGGDHPQEGAGGYQDHPNPNGGEQYNQQHQPEQEQQQGGYQDFLDDGQQQQQGGFEDYNDGAYHVDQQQHQQDDGGYQQPEDGGYQEQYEDYSTPVAYNDGYDNQQEQQQQPYDDQNAQLI